ncbi:MAG: hypothetical protein JXC36_01585, partial [Candidatus Atribacteria bacterium]|nr:hypothetical protein [Candidatus Atribacteria bacterium]
AFGDNSRDWEEASPINYLREGLAIPPFLLLVAGDREISRAVNQSFYQSLNQYHYDVTLFYVEDKDHVSIDYDLGKEGDAVYRIIHSWIQKISNINN